MRLKIPKTLGAVLIASIPYTTFSQEITLGTVADFALFSTNGAVTNSGITHLTGNVGTNNGSSTGFGNVDGVMHDADIASGLCATDLLLAYGQLDNAIPEFFLAALMGNGQVLEPGVYAIDEDATLNLELILDAQDDPDAVFIFQVQGTLSTGADATVTLANGALACNIFWKVEGLVSMATGTDMKGTIIANNAAINMTTGCVLEGRAVSTTGAVTTDGVRAYTPIGCGSPELTGPMAPDLGSAACYAIFSSNGAVANDGDTYVNGDIGSNSGSATGYNPLFVNGTIHAVPDESTAMASADLLVAYEYLNALTPDIELLYPAQFGNKLVLTPHTYLLDAATVFTDTLFLNAQGNPDAVFIIKINGALSTATYSTVKLINGTQSENIFWKVEGAVNINNHSVFHGTIICNNAALGAINTGVQLHGRALTTNGALSTTAINATENSVVADCALVSIADHGKTATGVELYPNPFSSEINIVVKNWHPSDRYVLSMYDMHGNLVLSESITGRATIQSMNLPVAGMYFYSLAKPNAVVQTGRLVAQ